MWKEWEGGGRGGEDVWKRKGERGGKDVWGTVVCHLIIPYTAGLKGKQEGRAAKGGEGGDGGNCETLFLGCDLARKKGPGC